MNKFQFTHEKTKKERGIDAHISTPPDLAQLLTQLLRVDKAEGKIIYDCCFGTGSLSQYVNTEKNVLIGDDKELTYLEQGQSNNPKAILFNHDALQCYGPTCYEHLVSKEWKEKVENHLEQIFGKGLRHFRQLGIIQGKNFEQIKEAENRARQIMLEFLIQQKIKQKQAK